MTLTQHAIALAQAGLDSIGMIGEAHAIDTLGMTPAPRRAKAIDGWIGERTVQVKTMVDKSNTFFGRLSSYEADDFLFVILDADTFEVQSTQMFDRATTRELIAAGAPSYRDGYLTRKAYDAQTSRLP